jgi:hypothetical protein
VIAFVCSNIICMKTILTVCVNGLLHFTDEKWGGNFLALDKAFKSLEVYQRQMRLEIVDTTLGDLQNQIKVGTYLRHRRFVTY